MKKLLSFILAFVTLFSALGLVHTSAEQTTFNGKPVNIGDTVVYSYYLKTPMKVVTTDFVINYTGDTLSLVNEPKNKRFPIVNAGGMFNDALENQIKATCSNISAMYDFTNGGYLFQISFTVIGGGASTASVTIPFLKGVNPEGISQPEVTLISNNSVVYAGVTVEEKSVVSSECKHNYVETRKPATCTQDGEIINTCSVCGATKTEKIPAMGHSFGQWKLNRLSTRTDEGEEVRTCSVDNAKESRPIPKLGTISGDLDGDGKQTGNDSLIIMKYIVRKIGKDDFVYSSADMNSDSIVNVKDATVIQKMAVGLLN